MMKKDPCCARCDGAVLREEAEVRRLVRLISRQEEHGRRTDSYRAQLATARTNLASARQVQAEHRAAHTAVVPMGQVLA